MIGNSHIDPVWLWQWPEGYQAVRATFRSALDRMNEYPEFIFTCDSAAYYEWIEEIEPAMFEEIRAAGRRRSLGDRRWLVGRARLQHPGRRVVRPPGARVAALFPREVRPDRDRWLQRRPVRPQRDAASASPPGRHGQLRLHASRAARIPPAWPGLLVGIGRRVAGADVPPAARVLLAERGSRLPHRQVDRPAARGLVRDDGLLRRRESRWRTDPPEPGQHPEARRAPVPCRGSARAHHGSSSTRFSRRTPTSRS